MGNGGERASRDSEPEDVNLSSQAHSLWPGVFLWLESQQSSLGWVTGKHRIRDVGKVG